MSSDSRRAASCEAGTPQSFVNLRRRGFLFSLGAGAVGAAAASSSVAQSGSIAQSDSQAEAPAGYRETEHVRDYYRTARL